MDCFEIEFYNFLKENGCFEQFFENMRNCKIEPICKEFYELAYNYIASDYISGAFAWHETTQGIDFWQNIENKWIKTVDKLLKQ